MTRPRIVTSLRMTPELRRRAKIYAAANDTSLQDVVATAVREFLAKRGG